MEPRDPQALVVGGGIAGLGVALALARRGIRTELLEQAPALTDIGTGLQISPNGARVLTALGLGPALASHGTPAQAVCLLDGTRDGGPLLRLNLSASQYWFIHRADLIALLADACRNAGVVLHLGQRVAAIAPGAPPVLTLSDGTRRSAALILGADGLQSQARAALNGHEIPFFTGQVAWRATIPAEPGAPAVVQVLMGPGRHLVSYPIRGGTLRNIVAVQERQGWAAEGWSHPDDPSHLRAAFADFRPEVQDWLGQVAQPLLWGLFRHPVAAHWHGPGIAILGDAAHSTLPFLAQGANMALEDAWVLAATIAKGRGLASYQQARQARTTRIVKAADANARAYHLAGPRRAAAHLALRLANATAPELMLRRFNWVYQADVAREYP